MKQSQHFLDNAENCAQLAERADDAPLLSAAVARRHAVEAGLRLQRVARIPRAQGDAEDAPARIVLEQRVGVDGLMAAMKRAEAEIDGLDLRVARDLIGRALDQQRVAHAHHKVVQLPS